MGKCLSGRKITPSSDFQSNSLRGKGSPNPLQGVLLVPMARQDRATLAGTSPGASPATELAQSRVPPPLVGTGDLQLPAGDTEHWESPGGTGLNWS